MKAVRAVCSGESRRNFLGFRTDSRTSRGPISPTVRLLQFALKQFALWQGDVVLLDKKTETMHMNGCQIFVLFWFVLSLVYPCVVFAFERLLTLACWCARENSYAETAN